MAYVTPTSRGTGEFITAAIWNQDAVDNPIALRTGALAMTSQAAGNFVLASSPTQLATNQDEQVVFFAEVFT